MKTVFLPRALDDLAEWVALDRKKTLRLMRLIEDARRHPYTGLGEPEGLKGNRSGWWSRRIDQEHRLIYRVTGKGSDQVLEIAQCRGHYT